MFVLKHNNLFRRTVIMVMILAVVHTGVLGGSAAVLAEPAEGVPDTVYQTTTPSEVTDSVYGGEVQGPVLPSALDFLQATILYQVPALAGDYTVRGTVYENSTGMPMTGVTVKLLLNGHPTQFVTSTDNGGSYNLTGVGLGQYQLSFQHPGYATEEFLIDFTGTDVTQDCNLLRNTSFKGRVVNEHGNSLEGAEVNLADQNLPDRSLLLSTNADGWFYINDVPPGRYRLSVSQSVYYTEKTIWVDEYPKDMEMTLSTEDVYDKGSDEVITDDNVNDDNANNDNANDDDVINDEEPNVMDEVYDQTSDEGDVESGTGGETSVSVFLDALKEHDPLTELNDMLKEQAAID